MRTFRDFVGFTTRAPDAMDAMDAVDAMDAMEGGVPYCACEKATVKVIDIAATHLLPTLLHG